MTSSSGAGPTSATTPSTQAGAPPAQRLNPGCKPESDSQRTLSSTDQPRRVRSASPPAHADIMATKDGGPRGRGIDLSRATHAVSELLDALGVNRDGDGLADT